MADGVRKRLENAIVALSREEEGGAVIAVLESEAGGATFEALGEDEDGHYLQDEDGCRHYMDGAHAFSLVEAARQPVLAIVEMDRESRILRQYTFSPADGPSPGMGSP